MIASKKEEVPLKKRIKLKSFSFFFLSCYLSKKLFPLFHLHLTLKLETLGVNIHNISLPASVRNEIIKLNKKVEEKKR